MREFTIVAVSVCAAGALGQDERRDGPLFPGEHCMRADLSDDGRYVVFDTMSSNLLGADPSPYFDVYLFDRRDKGLRLVSAGPGGRSGDGPSSHATISSDGRRIAFVSDAPDLVEDDSNAVSDIFIYEVGDGSLRRLPIAPAGDEPDGDSRLARISADGRFVVFHSTATNLVPGDVNESSDVFVHEIETGRTEIVSVSSEGDIGFHGSTEADISGDGRLVAFVSHADALAPNDFNQCSDVFVRDRAAGTTTLVSLTPSGSTGNDESGFPRISDDGSAIAFVSWATDLTAGGSEPGPDVFRFDVGAGMLACLSRGRDGEPGTGHSQNPAISSDGRSVLYLTLADNVAGVTLNDVTNVVLADAAGRNTLVSTLPDGSPTASECAYPGISGSGRFVVLSTSAGQLAGLGKLSKATVFVGSPGSGGFEPVVGPGTGNPG